MVKPILLTFLGTAFLLAQAPDMKTSTGMAQGAQATMKKNIVAAAKKMPEENYSFKPVPEVRSFGELLGHVANAEYNYCSGALNEKSPSTSNIEKTKTSKADIIAALEAAFDYCDKAYASLSESKMSDLGRGDRNKFGMLNGNVAHANEHYGNMVTYMRLKGLVPPSSEGK